MKHADRKNLPLLAAVVFAVAVVGVASVWRSQSQADLRRIAHANCESIEQLKALVREEARLSYARLDETLRLLRLERTAELEAVARRNRDEKLRRFQRRECPPE